jgi:5-methyltetrahydrofolate--homocysteine methyltransferase
MDQMTKERLGVTDEEWTALQPKIDKVRQLQMALDCPLVLDCTQPEALEKGLQEYHGKALINSVNGEEKSLHTILPLAKKYGAAVLGLTLNEQGIPTQASLSNGN